MNGEQNGNLTDEQRAQLRKIFNSTETPSIETEPLPEAPPPEAPLIEPKSLAEVFADAPRAVDPRNAPYMDKNYAEVFHEAFRNLPGSGLQNLLDTIRIFQPLDLKKKGLKQFAPNIQELFHLVDELGIKLISDDRRFLATAMALPLATPGLAIKKMLRGKDETPRLDAVIEFYKNNYGFGPDGEAGFKRFVAEDPVGFLLDAISILSLGSTVTLKGAQAARILPALRANRFLGAGIKALEFAQKLEAIDPGSLFLRGTGFGVEQLSKAFSPFKSSVDQRIIDLAAQFGIAKDDLPATVISKAKGVQIREGLQLHGADEFAEPVRRRIEASFQAIFDTEDQIVQRMGGIADTSRAGETAVAGTRAMFDATDAHLSNLYDELGDLTKIKGSYEQTNIALESLKKRSEFSDIPDTEIEKLESILEGVLTNKSPHLGNIKQTRTRFREQTKLAMDNKELTHGSQAVEQIYQGFTADLYNAAVSEGIRRGDPAFVKNLQEANAAYAEAQRTIKSEYAKIIFRNADKPSEIVKALLRPGSVPIEYIRPLSDGSPGLLFQLIGEEASTNVRTAFLNELFDRSQNRVAQWTPNGIINQIKSINPDRVRAILGDELYAEVSNLGELSQQFSKLRRVTEGSPTGFINEVLETRTPVSGILGKFALLSEMYGGGTIGKIRFLSAILGDTIFERWLNSADGRAFLLEGAPQGEVLRAAGEHIQTGANVPGKILRHGGRSIRALREAERGLVQ